MLAVAVLSGGWQALFFGLAVLAFLVDVAITGTQSKALALVPLGLALAFFVFFWNALALS